MNDNLKLVGMINSTLSLTQYTIEVAAKVVAIKTMIKSVQFTIIVKWINGY